MRTRAVTIVVAVVLAAGAGLAVGAVIWAGGDHADDSAGAQSMHGGGGTMAMAALDERSFLEQMAPHHESAVEMATMALERSTHPQLRRLARGIIDAQEGEIAKMRDWHRAWYGSQLERGTAMHTEMDALENATGPDFDREFLRLMIAHHASAIVMADAVTMDSPRAEVAALAREIIAAQSNEIGQMQRWREQWFPPLG
jgi:uncharacterized protein (DUF305 family)